MIKRVHITNFKSLVDVTVELDWLTVFIGRSGVGKSNFIAALRCVRDFLRVRGAHNFFNGPMAWKNLFPAFLPHGTTSFEITYTVPGSPRDFGYLLTFKVEVNNARAQLIDERLMADNDTIFHAHQGKWAHAPNIVGVAAPLNGTPMLGQLNGIVSLKIAYLALVQGLGFYDFPSDVLQGSEVKPNDFGFDDSGSNYLKAIEGISNNLTDLESFREIVSGAQKVNPSVSTLDLDSVSKNTVLVAHEFSEGVLTLPLSSESEGFRRFLAHLIAIYQVPTKLCLSFEEPEKGIYPGALNALADFFLARSTSKRSQIVLTTHSPALLDNFPVDSIRVVDMNAQATRIGRVAPEQVAAVRRNLETTGELLTMDPARIEDLQPS